MAKRFRITKIMLKKLLDTDVKTLGDNFNTDKIFILKKVGVDGLKKVEERFKALGHPFKYRDAKTNEYYNMGFRTLSFLIPMELFGWTKKDIFEMGENGCNFSLLIKVFARYFVSPKTALSYARKHWKYHMTSGQFGAEGPDMRKRVIKARISGLKIHPIVCVYLLGYFKKYIELVMPGYKFKIAETRCVNRKDDFHEFVAKW